MRHLLAAACFLPAIAQADELRLSQPIDCTLGADCHIQQFVDRDTGPGARDFMCSSLTYDGHNGTDFALVFDNDIEDGVAVLAAAAGTVTAVRDGMADAVQGRPGAPDVSDRECGNGVVVEHDDGWETQYCHMRSGSVIAEVGQEVEAGTPLGQVGLSGQTEFAHVQLSVRKDGEVVDPFEPNDLNSCDGEAQSLWADDLGYAPGAILAVDWSDHVPDYDQIKTGAAEDFEVGRNDPALVLWMFAYGARTGDQVRMGFDGPAGETFETEIEIDRPQARYFRAGGRRTPDGGWPAGDYTGFVEILRGGDVIDRMETAITLD